jgi:hypothetical protein
MPEDASALHLVLTGEPALFAIVRLSLIVSLSAVEFAALIGVPFGAFIALTRFRGREVVIVVLNALMGLPPVVVGLAVFLALSRSGPLGSWGLVFTPEAMVIVQTILVAPIIAALARQTIEDLWVEYQDELAAMNVGQCGPGAPRGDPGLGCAIFPRHGAARRIRAGRCGSRRHPSLPPCDAPPFAFRRDDIRLLVRLDLIADWISLPFAPRWKNNSSKSSSTDQFDWPPNQVRLASSTGQ